MAMRLAWLALPAVVLALSACGGGNKAGGSAHHTVVLTIANHESGGEDLQEYVSAVARLSGGSIRLEVRSAWRAQDIDYDRGTVADVRAGKVDLAKVAVRSFDLLGVDDFQALTAPYLVDGLPLEQRVLDSGVPAEVLPAARRLGVEGLALLPGPLRRPFGLTHRLLRPADYDGAVIGIRPGRVATLTFRTLGATPEGYHPGRLPPWAFDGAELDLVTLEGNNYDLHGSSLTANVAFWPRAVTVVGNRDVLARLSAKQREVLRQAGREATGPAIRRLRAEAGEETAILCKRDTMSFVQATPSQVAALRAAARPVYVRLERNAKTRALVSEIETLKQHAPPEPGPRCPGPLAAHTEPVSALDGTWEKTLSPAQLIATLHDPDARIDAGRYRLVFDRGQLMFAHVKPGVWRAGGAYTVREGTVVFRFSNGSSETLHWSVYRDTLTLRPARQRTGFVATTLAAWHRVRR
jgi:TRAP-type C4-dicarboxylate transport system substrate-binding protein